MRNVKDNQLKKCIFLTEEEFNVIVHQLFEDESIHVEFYCDGCITVEGIDSDKYFAEINQKLSVYFEIEIESMHIDDGEYPCMWIVYKD